MLGHSQDKVPLYLGEILLSVVGLGNNAFLPTTFTFQITSNFNSFTAADVYICQLEPTEKYFRYGHFSTGRHERGSLHLTCEMKVYKPPL